MKIGQSIAKRIKHYLKKQNMTRYKLAKLTAIPNSVLRKMLQGKYIGMKNHLYRIIKVFGISISEFFDEVYFDYNSIEIE